MSDENLAQDVKDQINLDTWSRRRRLLWTVVIFSMLVVGYCLWTEPSISEIVIISAFSLIGSVTLGYVFGAVWDDNNVLKGFLKK